MKEGDSLGPYRILAKLGEGGMGEVYKARDTRLDRTVAIKILPNELSADPDRRVRFEREARAVAAFSHPHICTLHDIGAHDGMTYLVMEHLPGQTLAERLLKGALPLAQALDIAVQIADALDAAHKHGIIHRDLKPGNVMLTTDGAGRSGATTAKLLDFGLAKLAAHGERAALAGGASVPTQAAPVTAEGTILGTLQYMAPEQLEGKEADARTDLWALGAVLYEMVTGRRAFQGDSQVSLIGNIMNAEPAALATLQPLTPPALERIVRKCVAKHPDDRWDTAHDVADELRWIAQAEPGAGAASAAISSQAPRRRLLRVLACTLVFCAGVAAGIAAWRSLARPAPSPVQHLGLPLSSDGLQSPSSVAISPDGQTVAFGARGPKGSRLYLRPLGRRETNEVQGTGTTLCVRFSEDGESLAFQDPTLRRASAVEGKAVPVGSRIHSEGMDWTPDGGFVFCNFADFSLSRARPDGRVETLLRVDKGKEGVSRPMWPSLLPGGDIVLFNILKANQPTVWAFSIRSKKLQQLPVVGSQPRYLPATGHLVYLSDGQLFAAPFDPERLEVNAAAARPVLDGVGGSGFFQSEWDVSRNGTLVYLGRAESRLVWTDRRGRLTVLPVEVGPIAWVTVSPDGRRAVITTAEGVAHRLYTVTLEGRATVTRLTAGDDDWYGAFTPDSRQVIYLSGVAGAWNMWAALADGSGQPRAMGQAGNPQQASSVRGRLLLYEEVRDGTSTVWLRELDRPETARVIVEPRAKGAVFSPDGRWIAYSQALERNRYEIYVQRFPQGPKQAISVGGGIYPIWNPRGGEVFYANRDITTVMSVRVVDGARVGDPVELFPLSTGGILSRVFDVMPDGERFLVAETVRPPQINVVLNWFEALKAKVPATR